MITRRELCEKYNIAPTTLDRWIRTYNIEPVKVVQRGKRQYYFYDEQQVVAILQANGYLNEDDELMKQIYGKRGPGGPRKE